MKKSIIVLAGIFSAYILNAASFTWGFLSSDYTNEMGDYMDSGTAFLYLGSVTASATGFDLSGATQLASASFDGTNYIYGNYDTDNLSSSDALQSTTAGQDYTLILVDKSVASLDGYEGNYYLSTGVSEQGDLPGVTVTHFAKFENYDTIAQDSWSTIQSIPEPTSGLLLLLGVAGLALKRKKA